MARLATRLQGAIVWDEHAVVSKQTIPEKRLLAAIMLQAISDLTLEIQRGYDIENPLRTLPAEGGAALPIPAKFNKGSFVAPFQWLIESTKHNWSFIWVCEHLQLDHFKMREAIFLQLGISNFIKLYGLRNICML